MRPSRNPGATQRATAELIASPGRSDRLIALAAGCEHRTVGRTRKRLEAAGTIPAVTKRTPRFPLGPREPGATQQAMNRLGPGATTRAVMDAAGVDRSAVWWARQHRRLVLPDAAAVTETLTVVKLGVPPPDPRPCTPVPLRPRFPYPVGWPRETRASAALCRYWCPVLAQCVPYGLAHPELPGIVGGLSQSERAAGLTEPQAPPRRIKRGKLLLRLLPP